MANVDYQALLHQQSGVISRRQVESAGLTANDVRRLVRRRELTRWAPGVYVAHTGPPTWLQRAWAAVLYAWPAALCDDSALRADDGPGRGGRDDSVIHVALERDRRINPIAGVRLHRLTGMEPRVAWNASPPRVRVEDAVLRIASRAPDDHSAIQTLADAVQSRRTTAERLTRALDERVRLRRRALIQSVLADIDAGACSTLEVGYLRLVERAHGLPVGLRQARASVHGPIYRDVLYETYGQIVELDGRLFHDNARARHRDLDRDLSAALEGLRTVRLGWGQVHGDPCGTALRVGELLRRGGWPGHPHPCPRCAGSASTAPVWCLRVTG